MLILTRYVGEKIMIGDDITIEVMDIYPCRGVMQSRIGITVSADISFPLQIVSPVCTKERITIGNDIFIEVVDAYPFRGRSQVKLGIEAPRDVIVHRLEIWEKMKSGIKFEKPEKSKSSSDQ